MKTIYTLLFLVFAFSVSAQEINTILPSVKDEIVGFKLYPNPAYNDVVHITTSQNAPKTVVIYDVFGEVLLNERLRNKTLSISHLTPGVYVMQVSEYNKTITRKLVVK